MHNNRIGLGDSNASLIVYTKNIPPLDEYNDLNCVRALRHNEIKLIADLTGNHWRKIFNCFAKLMFEINNDVYSTWQQYRDNLLLRESSNQLLLFSVPINLDDDNIKIICGKTYFNQLNLDISVEWLDEYFAINKQHKLIVSPYFDYRQLSNVRIKQLFKLIDSLI